MKTINDKGEITTILDFDANALAEINEIFTKKEAKLSYYRFKHNGKFHHFAGDCYASAYANFTNAINS